LHQLAGDSHKKIGLVYIGYFPFVLLHECPNSCMSGKDKYYIFLNVLKFEKYIVYVKVRIWIWWKC